MTELTAMIAVLAFDAAAGGALALLGGVISLLVGGLGVRKMVKTINRV